MVDSEVKVGGFPDLESKLKALAPVTQGVKDYSSRLRNPGLSQESREHAATVLRSLTEDLARIASLPVPNPRSRTADPEARFYTIAELRRRRP